MYSHSRTPANLCLPVPQPPTFCARVPLCPVPTPAPTALCILIPLTPPCARGPVHPCINPSTPLCVPYAYKPPYCPLPVFKFIAFMVVHTCLSIYRPLYLSACTFRFPLTKRSKYYAHFVIFIHKCFHV